MTAHFFTSTVKKAEQGFTLIELLIVIGILAVLMGIVLIAINPARQFSQANNTKRSSDVKTLLDAVGQYMADHQGDITSLGLTANGQTYDIQSSGGVDLCSKLKPTYVAALPTDPSFGVGDGGTTGNQVTDCSSYDTKYTITVATDSAHNNRITVAAPNAELGQTIAVTR